MEALTDRQQQVLDYISQSQAHTGVIPSTREIQEYFGFASQTAAMNHLKALERKGVISRRAGKARAVSVMANINREPVVDLPLYGSIAAGLGESGVEQQTLGTVSVDAVTLGISQKRGAFALKVRGDSMVDADIQDGDLAVFEVREPRPRDVVAALIDGETTLKRFIVDHGRTYLKAENPDFPDLIPTVDLQVQGVMVALIRKMRVG
ncbi:MAG TPA: transcriptional repressor LexA [Chthoniobacteraceae bacterium]|nr:transcriptional repressor LexA [Chthoniobacteraceae bacterium]